MAKKPKKNAVVQSQEAKAASNASFLNKMKQGINSALPSQEGIAEIVSDVTVLENDADRKTAAESALNEIKQLLEVIRHKISEHEDAKDNYNNLSSSVAQQEISYKEKEKELQNKIDEANARKEALDARQSKLESQAKDQLVLEEELLTVKREANAGFIQDQRRIVEEGRLEVESLQKESLEQLSNKVTQVKQQEKYLLEREIEISEREASAKAGFVNEQKTVLESIEAEKKALETELAKQRHKLEEELESHKHDVDTYKNEQLAELDKERDTILRNAETIKAHKRQIETEKQVLQVKLQSQKEWEAELEEKVNHKFSMEICDLQSQLLAERTSRENDQSMLTSLHEQLRQYKDLERTLKDQDIESVQDELSNSRQTIKDLKAKLHNSDQEDLGERNEELEDRIEEQSEKIIDLRRELEESSGELHTTRLSVMAKHNLEKEKQILELHNRTLDSAINGLQTQLDELVDKQQGSKAFPALSQLDQKYRNEAANLQVVPSLKDFAEQIRLGLASIDPEAPLFYRREDSRLFIAGLSMSSLHILQGMSGTGKTSLATTFADVVGGHCTLIPVQAGWRDKDDLIGHYNAFEKKFYEKEALQAIYKAQLPAYRDRINFIVLDEMNLSRPEQYFSEFLSAMEIKSSKRDVVLVEEAQSNAPTLLIDGRKIRVPENIWFIGTANHDETTNEFADKTYDRAHVMELRRSDEIFSTDGYDHGMTYSFKSLQDAFAKAVNKHESKLKSVLSGLNESLLSNVLSESFEVSWGNRLDSHAKRFISAMVELGGSLEEGLDHLLATKVFRRGKVTGRFDININDLDAVEDALLLTWNDLKLKGKPSHSLECITKDKKRMERNV